MDWPKIAGENIRRTRVQKGLPQEEVAHRVGLATSYFGQVERGVRNPTISVLGRIADVLDVPLTSLLETDS